MIYDFLHSNSQAGIVVAPFGVRKIESSSDVADRSSASDCNFSLGDKVCIFLTGVWNFELRVLLAERQLATDGEAVDLPVESPRPVVEGARSFDRDDAGGRALLGIFAYFCDNGVLVILFDGLTMLLVGVKRARTAFSF